MDLFAFKEAHPDAACFGAAAERRDAGIEASEASANRHDAGWSDHAYHALQSYMREFPGRRFLCEEVRGWAEAAVALPTPPNQKAWGGIMQRAARAKLIVKTGAREAKSSNLSLKPEWAAGPAFEGGCA